MAKKKVGDSKMDFDFDDISGKQHIVDSNKLKYDLNKIKPKLKKKEKTLSGINLTIPTEDGQMYSRDLSECTGEEFVAWIEMVYPFGGELYPTDFETIDRRRRAFNDIVDYHRVSIFGSNPDVESTKH